MPMGVVDPALQQQMDIQAQLQHMAELSAMDQARGGPGGMVGVGGGPPMGMAPYGAQQMMGPPMGPPMGYPMPPQPPAEMQPPPPHYGYSNRGY